MTEDEALERIATEALLAVDQAAAAVQVSPWTIRQWVNRGHLQPVPGIRPIVFFETDVYACQTRRRGTRRAAHVTAAAASWRGVQSDAGRTTMPSTSVKRCDPATALTARGRGPLVSGVNMHDATTDFDPQTDEEYLARRSNGFSTDYDRERVEPFAKGALPPRSEAMTALGSVLYAIRTQDGLVKIGFTSDLAKRMRHYGGRTLLAVKAGTRATELDVNQQLRAHVAHGREYYHPTPEVMALVNEWREAIGLPLAS